MLSSETPTIPATQTVVPSSTTTPTLNLDVSQTLSKSSTLIHEDVVYTKDASVTLVSCSYCSNIRCDISKNISAFTWELECSTSRMDFIQAQNHCLNKSNEWRLPDVWELFALYLQKSVLGENNIALDFWFSTIVEGEDYGAHVYFGGGKVYCDLPGNMLVRCVRG